MCVEMETRLGLRSSKSNKFLRASENTTSRHSLTLDETEEKADEAIHNHMQQRITAVTPVVLLSPKLVSDGASRCGSGDYLHGILQLVWAVCSSSSPCWCFGGSSHCSVRPPCNPSKRVWKACATSNRSQKARPPGMLCCGTPDSMWLLSQLSVAAALHASYHTLVLTATVTPPRSDNVTHELNLTVPHAFPGHPYTSASPDPRSRSDRSAPIHRALSSKF